MTLVRRSKSSMSSKGLNSVIFGRRCRLSISSAVAPQVGTAANFTLRQAVGEFQEDRYAFYSARIHHRDVGVVEAAEIGILGNPFEQ